ncbi:hypothetical protein OCU04_000540 [Sclerotinia nivalis]|uniref:Uncharacterized protein n=1 Tax=Sclerotinia nivalis TaxID=352851 RepID=A0A9X0AXB4_9HELO|nr:hypothetical protein OCU04_000540 [Sclerotinia nivalis]
MSGITMKESTVQEDYMFSRGIPRFRTVFAAPTSNVGWLKSLSKLYRLHVQHLLWNMRLGWLIHPFIPLPVAPKKEDMFCIADIGIGNA